MSEVMTTKKEKKKFSLRDNFVVLPLVGFVLLILGQALGLYGLRKPMAAFVNLLIPGFSATDVWTTAVFYLDFVGIWIVMLLAIALIPRNRPILKALTTKTRGNTPKMFAVGLGIGLGLNLLCAFIAMLNGDIYITFDSVRPISLLFVFVTVLIQSAAEELVCRVFIYQRLMRRYNHPIFVAVVNAGFFALIHIFNDGIGILPLVNLFIHGLMFSAMVIYLDSPWAAMAGHAGWNFCQNILLGLPNSGNLVPYSVFKLDAAAATDSFAYSVAFGLEGAIVCTVVTLIAVGLIAWWGTKHKVTPTPVWDDQV